MLVIPEIQKQNPPVNQLSAFTFNAFLQSAKQHAISQTIQDLKQRAVCQREVNQPTIGIKNLNVP